MGITGVRAENICRSNPYRGAVNTMVTEKFEEDILLAGNTENIDSGGREYRKDNGIENVTKEEIFEMISNRIRDMYIKVKNNDTEPSFQIGSQSFTEKEWNEVLEQFDSAQEEIREQMKEEQAKRQKDTAAKVNYLHLLSDILYE